MSYTKIKSYLDMKTLVESITGFSLPLSVPGIGVQVDISIPYFDVYKDWQPAKMVYLGDEQFYLNSPTTGEEYRFNGLDKDYSGFKILALDKRQKERFLRVRKQYAEAVEIDPVKTDELSKYELDKVANFQNKKPNPDVSPTDYSELKKLDDRIIQAFYTERLEDKQGQGNDQLPKIIAIREIGKTEPLEFSPNLPFCHHVHRYSPKLPTVWVVGYSNAVQALKRLPDFTVKETFNLEFLINTVQAMSYKENPLTGCSSIIKDGLKNPKPRNFLPKEGTYSIGYKDGNFYKDSDVWFALTPVQLREVNLELDKRGIDLSEEMPFSFIILEGVEE